jgi:hypothetical protein
VLREDIADGRHLEVEDESEDRLLSGGANDLADDREIDGGEKEIGTVAEVNCLADVDALLSLSEDNEAGLVSSGDAGARFRAAIKAQAGDFRAGIAFCECATGDGSGELRAQFDRFVASGCYWLSYGRHASDPQYST